VNSKAGVIAMQLPAPASQPHMAIGIGAEIKELRSRRTEFVELLEKTMQPYRAALPSNSPQLDGPMHRP
jgi:hypothetical protein